jgi:Tfp pilus assembly protein PilO
MVNQKLLALLFFLLSFFVFKQFLMPNFAQYGELKKELLSSQKEYENYNNIKSALTQKKISDETLSKLEILNFILPKELKQDFYIESISSLVNSSGLILNSIDVGPRPDIVATSDFQDIIINLKLEGDYESFGRFLKAVANNITPLEIAEMSISSFKKIDKNLFQFNIKILTRITL